MEVERVPQEKTSASDQAVTSRFSNIFEMAWHLTVQRAKFSRMLLYSIKLSRVARGTTECGQSRKLSILTFQTSSRHNLQSRAVVQFQPFLARHPGSHLAIISTTHNYSTSENDKVSEVFTEDPSTTLTDVSGISTESVATTAQDVLQPIQEIPFQELGLGGYSPIGILQSCLEWLHVSAGLPWWATIVTATIVARCVMFPIIVKNQRASIRLNNVMPTFQKLTQKMNEARQSGNQYEVTRHSMELQRYVKKHDINPLKTMVGVLVQAPVFISFFIGLRRMAQLPVESMTVGGLSWFTDLTTTDPYYALPVLASLSMFAVIQLGAEAGVSSAQAEKIKTVLKIMPFAILPIIASLPKAVFIYWLTSNAFSLTQVAILKVPSVRQAFKIPERIKHDPSDLPKQEGFFKGMKSGWENAKVQHEVDARMKTQEEVFRQAGTGPVPQTFVQDPTRPQPSASQSTSTGAKPVRRKVR